MVRNRNEKDSLFSAIKNATWTNSEIKKRKKHFFLKVKVMKELKHLSSYDIKSSIFKIAFHVAIVRSGNLNKKFDFICILIFQTEYVYCKLFTHFPQLKLLNTIMWVKY